MADRDREVVLVVVPDVFGLSSTEAANTILGAGLTFSGFSSEASDVTPGNASRTEPAAGSSVEALSAVIVFLSTGPAPPPPGVVPNVAGSTQEDAIRALEFDGYLPRVVGSEFSLTVDADRVSRTDPRGGSVLAPGMAVAIFISLGSGGPPEPPTDPPVFIDE